MNTRSYIAMAAAAIFINTPGCAASNRVTGANVAYCEANPNSTNCPGILKRAEAQGVDADQEALANLRKESWTQDKLAVAEARAYSTRRVGRIVDVQIVPHGTPGSNVGSALGSATAQAGYIDNTILGSGNYSATGQLGAGILGAIIGSAFDQPAESWYAVHYWINFGNGPREVPVSSYSPTYAPKGTCVVAYHGKVAVTDPSECKD